MLLTEFLSAIYVPARIVLGAAGMDGARHLGNTRGVFERHYLDPRLLCDSVACRLPRPAIV